MKVRGFPSNTSIRFVTSKKLSFLAVCLLLLASSSALTQSVQNQTRGDKPLHMLVLGDSILWGQGLKPEHKTWHHVKLWLEKNTGRRVVERIEAHSGAVIVLFCGYAKRLCCKSLGSSIL